MSEAFTVFAPLAAFMLIPVWIPLLAFAGGAVADRVLPERVTPAYTSVSAAKERSARARAERLQPVVGRRVRSSTETHPDQSDLSAAA